MYSNIILASEPEHGPFQQTVLDVYAPDLRDCLCLQWHDPGIVSPRGLLADTCSQAYCCDSGYVDRQGRPYMVGCIDLFEGPHHDPSKHLLAIYYVLERLVVNFNWPDRPNFCYLLELEPPPDPPPIDFDVANCNIYANFWGDFSIENAEVIWRSPEKNDFLLKNGRLFCNSSVTVQRQRV